MFTGFRENTRKFVKIKYWLALYRVYYGSYCPFKGGPSNYLGCASGLACGVIEAQYLHGKGHLDSITASPLP